MANVNEPDDVEVRMSKESLLPSALAMTALAVSDFPHFYDNSNQVGEVICVVIVLAALMSFWLLFVAPAAVILNADGIRFRKLPLVPWGRIDFISISSSGVLSLPNLSRTRIIEFHSNGGHQAFDEYSTDTRVWRGNQNRYGTPLVLVELSVGSAEAFVEAVHKFQPIEVRYLRGVTARRSASIRPFVSNVAALVIGLLLAAKGVTSEHLGRSFSPSWESSPA